MKLQNFTTFFMEQTMTTDNADRLISDWIEKYFAWEL